MAAFHLMFSSCLSSITIASLGGHKILYIKVSYRFSLVTGSGSVVLGGRQRVCIVSLGSLGVIISSFTFYIIVDSFFGALLDFLGIAAKWGFIC